MNGRRIGIDGSSLFPCAVAGTLAWLLLWGLLAWAYEYESPRELIQMHRQATR